MDSWNPTRNPRDRKKKKIKRKKERKKRKEKERKRKKEKKKKSKYKLLLLVLLTSPFPHFRGPGKLRSLYYYHIIPYSRVPRNIIETRKSVTARSSPAQPKPSPAQAQAPQPSAYVYCKYSTYPRSYSLLCKTPNSAYICSTLEKYRGLSGIKACKQLRVSKLGGEGCI